MKKRLLLMVLFLLAVNFFILAEDNPKILARRIRIDILEFAHPFIPDISKLVVETPLSVFTDANFIANMNVRLWYLAASPFFLPDVFYEIGLLPELIFIQKKSFHALFGIGTAFSQTRGVNSIPLIISIKGKFLPLKWLEIQAALESLVYGEGFISDANLITSIELFKSGFIFNLGFGGSIGYSWTNQQFAYSYGLSTGLGYTF